MSGADYENGAAVEAKSSVKIEVDSKGQIKPTVKLVEGFDQAEVDRMVTAAASAFQRAIQEATAA